MNKEQGIVNVEVAIDQTVKSSLLQSIWASAMLNVQCSIHTDWRWEIAVFASAFDKSTACKKSTAYKKASSA